MAFLSVRDVPGVLGGVGSPTERASTSLDSDSLAGLRTSFTDTSQTKMNKDVNLSYGYECDLQDNKRARKTQSFETEVSAKQNQLIDYTGKHSNKAH